MSAPSMLSEAKDNLATFWGARNEREKKQIVFAALVAILGLTYMLLLEPAYLGRIHLQKSLPTLRQQVVELEALSKEASSLANVSAPPVPDMTKESLEAVLTRVGAKPQSVTVSGELAKIQFSSVSFAAMVTAMDELQKTARVSVTEANIKALPQQDTVDAALTLRRQKNE